MEPSPASRSPGISEPTTPRESPVGVSSGRLVLAVLLFFLTLFTTTTLGAGWYLSTRTDVTTDLLPLLSPETVSTVWSDPNLRRTGLQFSLPALLILLCHELGHYLACRRYRILVTPPYFLPAPVGLGTFGAFIRIKSPIRDKRQLLDVGAAGPIAGFVALIPFLFYGIAKSVPAPITIAQNEHTAELLLLLPGKSLAIELTSWLFHGRLQPGWVLDLHPFALAAWLGLLATSLNLLPLSQLDGGHILYAASGRAHKRLTYLMLALLVVAGAVFWRGWIFWCLVVLIMGLGHPRVLDESVSLDRSRMWVAMLCLVIFVLAFMPVPITVVPMAT